MKNSTPQLPGHVRDTMIFRAFKRGILYESLYKDHAINQKELIAILQKNIKGNYDYQQILSGSEKSQKQFLKHLGSRWNPLEPDAPWEKVSPYVVLQDNETDDKE